MSKLTELKKKLQGIVDQSYNIGYYTCQLDVLAGGEEWKQNECADLHNLRVEARKARDLYGQEVVNMWLEEADE